MNETKSEKAEAKPKATEPIASAPAAPTPETFDRVEPTRGVPADAAVPKATGDAAEEYRTAYRQLAQDDPDAIKGFPNPNRPGQNIDFPTVLAELRRRQGGLRGVPAATLKAGVKGR